ncbi:MAG: MotA/TolQ/ExbB proton channel family protein [Phycisphaeraceae bacterium]|nr:MotA/TolQ/ExbB proton channel family protein [Phycisphaeraceae bacterium]
MLELFRQGGWVVGVILSLSVVAWILIVWEWTRLHQQSGGDWRWVDEMLDAVEAGQSPPARLVERYRQNLVGRLLGLGLERSSRPRRSFHRQVMPHLKSERIALYRPLRLIAVMAAMMPLLGLLGTVMGMVTTFDVLMIESAARVESMAGGISQALITTQVGLVAAVPVLLAHGYLRSRARRYVEMSSLMLKRLESVVCYE